MGTIRRPTTSTPARRRARIAGACGLAAVGWATGVPFFGGRRRTDYRHEPRPSYQDARPASRELAINLVDFLPTGIFSAAFASLGARSYENPMAAAGVRCFSGVSVGYLTAAFAPGNPGGPTDGTLRQAVHNGAGVFEYASGAAGLVLFGLGTVREPDARWLSRGSLLLAAPYTVVLAGSALTGQPETRRRLQGLLEGTLFAWMIATSTSLIRRR